MTAAVRRFDFERFGILRRSIEILVAVIGTKGRIRRPGVDVVLLHIGREPMRLLAVVGGQKVLGEEFTRVCRKLLEKFVIVIAVQLRPCVFRILRLQETVERFVVEGRVRMGEVLELCGIVARRFCQHEGKFDPFDIINARNTRACSYLQR